MKCKVSTKMFTNMSRFLELRISRRYYVCINCTCIVLKIWASLYIWHKWSFCPAKNLNCLGFKKPNFVEFPPISLANGLSNNNLFGSCACSVCHLYCIQETFSAQFVEYFSQTNMGLQVFLWAQVSPFLLFLNLFNPTRLTSKSTVCNFFWCKATKGLKQFHSTPIH